LALAFPDVASLSSRFSRVDFFSLAVTFVLFPAASALVVFLTLPPASSVDSTLVVATNRERLTQLLLLCVQVERQGWRGGTRRRRAGGVGKVTPLPESAAVGPPLPVLRVPGMGPVLVGVKVTLMVQVWAPSSGSTPGLVASPVSVAGQLLVCGN
jgi:hypothetical protein